MVGKREVVNRLQSPTLMINTIASFGDRRCANYNLGRYRQAFAILVSLKMRHRLNVSEVANVTEPELFEVYASTYRKKAFLICPRTEPMMTLRPIVRNGYEFSWHLLGLSAHQWGCNAMAFTPLLTILYLRSWIRGSASITFLLLPSGNVAPVQSTSAELAALGQMMESIFSGEDCSAQSSCWPENV
jgi:hypothetical protein